MPVLGTIGAVAAALPAGITGSGTFDVSRSLYNFKPSQVRRARAALTSAGLGAGYFRAHCFGDSLTAGAYPTAGTTVDVTSYPVYLSALLAGQGFARGGTGWVPPWANVATWKDSRWTVDAAFAIPGGGDAKVGYLTCTTSGKTATFTSNVAGTIVDIMGNPLGGGFTYSIDGGGAVAYPGGAKVTVTGLANTTHTVAITTTSTTATFLCAVQVRGSTGVLVSNYGIGSSSTSDWMTSAAASKPGNAYRATETPDLTIIEYMALNDATIAGIAAGTSRTQLQDIAAASQAISDVLLVMPPRPATTTVSAAAWLPYIQNAYAVADALNLPLLDLGEVFVSHATANASGLYGDDLHPSALGYRLFASSVLAAVTA